MIDQLILFHKSNKKVKSEKKMDHFIPKPNTLLETTANQRFKKGQLHGCTNSRFLLYFYLCFFNFASLSYFLK
jgi:hypothetical protein